MLLLQIRGAEKGQFSHRKPGKCKKQQQGSGKQYKKITSRDIPKVRFYQQEMQQEFILSNPQLPIRCDLSGAVRWLLIATAKLNACFGSRYWEMHAPFPDLLLAQASEPPYVLALGRSSWGLRSLAKDSAFDVRRSLEQKEQEATGSGLTE